MIPMWMCPGCGPFSLRRPACALSFGAATWSHDVSTVVWIRGIPKWTLLLSHPLPFSWLRTDGKIVGQTFRLLNYSDSYQANSETCHCQSFSSEPFIRSHHEISWENPWSTLCPGPVYSPFAHQLYAGHRFAICVAIVPCASIMQKKFRIAEGLRCGLGSTPLRSADSEGTCSLNRHECSFALLLIKKHDPKTLSMSRVFFYNSHFLIAILSGTWFYPPPFLVGSSMFIPILSIQNSLHLLWLSSPFLMYKSTLSAGELPFLMDKSLLIVLAESTMSFPFLLGLNPHFLHVC